ncbi:MAG: patatin-like phospholipase family protein [Pseudomonadota bacterium]|nr:patatin-like phospholipase family protein [Pseudomonadota bacterium]
MPKQKTALVLSGGGARAAYQVGVLRAIAEVLPKKSPLPFEIVSGTSAGSLNAAGLAAHAHNFQLGINSLSRVWANLSSEQVFKTRIIDFLGTILDSFGSGGDKKKRSSFALLNNEPLAHLLEQVVNFKKVGRAIDSGLISTLCINATSYQTGRSICFYQGRAPEVDRPNPRRAYVPTSIAVDHLLASSAIPFLFPARQINGHFFSDGAIGQTAPLSSSINFGADRLVVIGVSDEKNVTEVYEEDTPAPSIAKIFSHVMNSAFLDTFRTDITRLERINEALSFAKAHHLDPSELDTPYRSIPLLNIFPSQSLTQMANEFREALPHSMKSLGKFAGGSKGSGDSALSYLLFENEYTGKLMELGYHDAMMQEAHIIDFFKS